MYYISRIVAQGKYELVNTDTGEREVVGGHWVHHLAVELGVEVKGVSLRKMRDGSYAVSSIVAWQPVNSRSMLQVKAKAIHGIDISKSGDEIVGISVQATDRAVFVRLSDYGTKYGAYVIKNRPILGNVTFILDDSIELERSSFKGWWGRVRMDISQVTKMSIVNTILSDDIFEYDTAMNTLNQFVSFITDRAERHGYPHVLWVLNNWHYNKSQMGYARNMLSVISPEVKALASKRYYRKFINLGKLDVKVSPDAPLANLETLASVIRVIPPSAWACFEGLITACYQDNLIDMFEHMLKVDFKLVTRLYNYVVFFDAEQAVKDAFVKFCTKAAAAILREVEG